MDIGSANLLYDKWLKLNLGTSDVPKLDAAIEAKQAYLKGYIGKQDFTTVLIWTGYSGLDIVEILEELEPHVDKTAPIFHPYEYKIINGELCSIPRHSL